MSEYPNQSPYHNIITDRCLVGQEGDLIRSQTTITFDNSCGEHVSTLYKIEIDPAIVRQMPETRKTPSVKDRFYNLLRRFDFSVIDGPNILK